MRNNYPAAERGGVTQQRYEQKTCMQRKGIQTMLQTAGVSLEGLRTVVDPGCRNGDTTLGLLQATSKDTRVIGVEEFGDALALARLKFGIHTDDDRKLLVSVLDELLALSGTEFYGFRDDAKPHLGRVELVHSRIDELPKVVSDAELVAGFQLLHWLDRDDNGLPESSVMEAIANCMRPGATFISGTSTAFVEIDPTAKIEGMTREQYSMDNHPFVQKVYELIEDSVKKLLGRAPIPVSARSQLSLDALVGLLESSGFENVETGAFLVTPGREEVITEVVKLRPKHQGRLEGVDEAAAAEITGNAIADANRFFDSADPSEDARKVGTNIYDAVPYVKATKKAEG